jgi:hypothetical protein
VQISSCSRNAATKEANRRLKSRALGNYDSQGAETTDTLYSKSLFTDAANKQGLHWRPAEAHLVSMVLNRRRRLVATTIYFCSFPARSFVRSSAENTRRAFIFSMEGVRFGAWRLSYNIRNHTAGVPRLKVSLHSALSAKPTLQKLS